MRCIQRGGRVYHHVAAGVVFRKGDEVADGIAAAEEAAQTVEAKGNAAVRGRAVFKGVEQEAEAVLCFFRRKTQEAEHALLQGPVVDTNRSATYFHSVDDQVVGIGTHRAGIAVHQVHVFRQWTGKRMVHGVPASGIGIKLQQGEIYHPQGLEIEGIAQAEFAAHFQAQFIHLLAGFMQTAGKQQHQVAGVRATGLLPTCKVFLSVELVHAGTQAAIGFYPAPDQAFGTNLRTFHKIRQLVQLLTGIRGSAGRADGNDHLGTIKHRKTFAFGQISNFTKRHAEAHIGFIAAVQTHRVGVCHAGQFGQFGLQHFLKQLAGQAFKGVQDVLALYEAHLTIHLGKLRLTIGAQVFVAEALHNLEILIKAAHHEQLLEGLRTLG